MKRTIALKLAPTPEQARALECLTAEFAAARNALAVTALEHRCTNRVRLHHLAYYPLRERFPKLGAQMACNAIASVARSLKAHRANSRDWKQIAFRPNASVHFDARTYRLAGDRVSLFTMHGRELLAMRVASFQRSYLERGTIREAELVRRRGWWYLHVVLDLPEVAPGPSGAALGVD